jgi:uncharacterized membrane protein
MWPTKALSPGINDPTTAVHALGHASALLVELTGHELRACVLTDDGGLARIVIERPDFADVLELVMTQPRLYGSSDPRLLGRLYQVLTDVAWNASSEHRAPVLDQLERLRATASDQDFDEVERTRLDSLDREVGSALDRSRRP